LKGNPSGIILSGENHINILDKTEAKIKESASSYQEINLKTSSIEN